MLQFLSLKPEFFGLDISDSSLKILQLKRKRKKFFLNSFGEEKIESGLIEGGEIKNERKLIEVIKSAIKKVKGKKIKTKYCVVSLPEEKAFLQVIKMPQMPEEDLKSAVVFESENYIPLPIDQVYLDCQVVSSLTPDSKKLDVLIAAVPKEIVNSYLSVLKKSNLKPIAFEVESQAIVRALIEKETTSHPVLIIDLGATRTSFIIFAQNSIRFTCSIPVSSIHFTELIAKNLSINFSEAEELKKKYGLEQKIAIKLKEQTIKQEKREIFEALIPALVDLVQQIKKHLDFYETHFFSPDLKPSERKIQKILLCGGGANLKGLLEFLTVELKIPVEMGNPWVNVFPGKKEVPGLSFEKSLGFTTAIGLAQREYD